jgi:hypothetical protein
MSADMREVHPTSTTKKKKVHPTIDDQLLGFWIFAFLRGLEDVCLSLDQYFINSRAFVSLELGSSHSLLQLEERLPWKFKGNGGEHVISREKTFSSKKKKKKKKDLYPASTLRTRHLLQE